MLVEREATDQTMHTGSSVAQGAGCVRLCAWRGDRGGGRVVGPMAKNENDSDDDCRYFFGNSSGEGESSEGSGSGDAKKKRKSKKRSLYVVSFLIFVA